MRPLVQYGAAAIAVVAAAILGIAPFATTFVEQWSRRDVELRSTLVFNSVRNELENLLAANATQQVDNLFGRLVLDERLLAVGFCDAGGTLLFRSELMPAAFSCQNVARTDRESFSTIEAAGRPTVVGSFPINTDKVRGHLVLLHDLTFALQRGAQARTWVIIALAAVALVGVALASLISLLVMRGWLQSVRRAIEEVRTGRRANADLPDSSAIDREVVAT